MKDHYIAALKQIIASDETLDLEVLLRDLKQVLTERGHARLLPAILRGLVTQLPKQANAIVVTLASNTDLKAHAEEIAATVKEITGADAKIDTTHVSAIHDDSLIGGYTVSVADTLIDRSYKTTLLQLYRTITN